MLNSINKSNYEVFNYLVSFDGKKENLTQLSNLKFRPGESSGPEVRGSNQIYIFNYL